MPYKTVADLREMLAAFPDNLPVAVYLTNSEDGDVGLGKITVETRSAYEQGDDMPAETRAWSDAGCPMNGPLHDAALAAEEAAPSNLYYKGDSPFAWIDESITELVTLHF